MELLDLPPEIFQHVIHQLVSVAGVNAAWQCRRVCRTFAAEIRHDVTANQPLRAFDGYDAIPLFGKIAATVLFNRTLKLLDVHPTIPNKIKGTLDALMQHASDDTPSVRDQYTKTLCEAVAREFVLYYKLRNGYGNVVHSAVADVDQVAAAFVLNNQDLIDAVCAQLAYQGFEESDLFGSPLVNLVKYGTTTLVTHTMEHLPGLSDPAAKKALSGCVFAAMEKKDLTLVKILVQKYEGNFTAVDKPTYNVWLRASIRADDVDMVEYALKIKIKSSPRVIFDAFEDACAVGNVEIVKSLLGKGRINPNQLHYRNSPLRCAVRSFKSNVVQAVLDAGADASGPVDESDKNNRLFSSPLCAAIRTGQQPIVQLLLDSGASLKANKSIFDSPLGAASKHGMRSIYNLIRKAKVESEGIEIPIFEKATSRNMALIAQHEIQKPLNTGSFDKNTPEELTERLN